MIKPLEPIFDLPGLEKIPNFIELCAVMRKLHDEVKEQHDAINELITESNRKERE